MKEMIIRDLKSINKIEEYIYFIRKNFGTKLTPEAIILGSLKANIDFKLEHKQYEIHAKRFRKIMWREQNEKCYYCFRHIALNEATIDHKIPIKRNGSILNRSNYAVCCYLCNSEKGILTEEEFLLKKLSTPKTLQLFQEWLTMNGNALH